MTVPPADYENILSICEVPFPLRTHEQWAAINEAALKYIGYPNAPQPKDQP